MQLEFRNNFGNRIEINLYSYEINQIKNWKKQLKLK